MPGGFFKLPTNDGKQWVMDWDDYVAHGFKEELAYKEDMPPRHKLKYMELRPEEVEDE